MEQVTDFFKHLLDASDWPSRWHCGRWSAFHGWLYIASDLLTWSAYFTISLVIVRFITKKSQARFLRLYILFAIFIMACGTTHLLDALSFWYPAYRLSALIRFITAVVSWATIYHLVGVLPLAFSMKSSGELQAEIELRKLAEARVNELNSELERRVEEKTAEVIRRLTGQKEAELLLRKSEANLQTIFDNTVTGYVLMDQQLKVTAFNRQAADHSGEQFQKQLAENTYGPGYFPRSRQDKIEELMNTAMHGVPVEYETSYPQRDGSFRWFCVSFSGISDAEGTNHGLLFSVTDINERKQAALERDRVIADLIRRNSTLEQFTYIVSHSLRPPVSSILGICYLFRDLDLDEEESAEMMSALTGVTRDLDSIVIDLNNILHVSQPDCDEVTNISFKQLVEECKLSLGPLIDRENASIRYDFSAAGSVISIQKSLYSVFHNLIQNAIRFRRPEAIPDLFIRSSLTNGQVYLSFTDNGKGIDVEKTRGELFGLYKRFDPSVDGRGMGLFMVKTQLEILNGSITLTSQPGMGSTFTVALPGPAV
ncbi:sensor histidine kinase [Hufsiella ginkgonis]|uniref:histidine kinase n=1 Tax=Hufsiella ginkgonis TaxID=2695274 RepID=A0A7K1Y043_9SPHI|nr:PAS domain-containing sensor histidine kinase [Hufsiella ginkgonis]MXV16641.1 PAS domain S-box protein [Hufsiella ginkgonis]